MPLNVTSSRGGYGEERYETNSFQRKVYETYKKLRDDTWKVNHFLSLHFLASFFFKFLGESPRLQAALHQDENKSAHRYDYKPICFLWNGFLW